MAQKITLRHPGTGDTVALASGFSWGAMLLGFVWAMSKKMWFAAFIMCAVNMLLFFSGLWGDTIGTIGLVLSIVFGVACGAYGNAWHRAMLEQRGYRVVQSADEGGVTGAGIDRAQITPARPPR
jgi:hypothetical protein